MKKIMVGFISIVVVVIIFVLGAYLLFRVNFEKGNKFYSAGKYREALIQYQKAEKFTMNDIELYHVIAATYGKLKQYEQAISYYKKIISLNPKDAKAYKLLGFIYAADVIDKSDKERLGEAVGYIEKALALNPMLMNPEEKGVFDFLKQQSGQ